MWLTCHKIVLMKKLILQLTFLLVFAITGFAQNWSQLAKLDASDQEPDDNHAISVAISGDYAIAGAWHEDHDASGANSLNNAGSAYIYHYNSSTKEWTEEAKLVAADREAGDEFGIAVAISGTYAVVGAAVENGARGAAYVFERNNNGVWVQVHKLEAVARQSSDRFGKSVAISGNTIVVGAHHEDENENEMNTLQNAGSAYIFTRVNGVWGFAQKIVASDRDVNDEFGYSVGIDEDKIIVGAYKYDPDGAEIGGAYTFALDGGAWKETRVIKAATPEAGDRFGWSVDVHGSHYIVGAPYHDFDDAGGGFHNNAGAAYIYDAANSWAEDKVVGTDRNDQDNLGEDVAIYNSIAVVGAPLQNFGVNGNPPFFNDGGALFVYNKDGNGFWLPTQKLLTGDRFSADKFGHAVDIDGDFIAGGAPENNQDAPAVTPSSGSLYVFNNQSVRVLDIDFRSTLNAYPNPTTGQVTLDLGAPFSEVSLTLHNMLGQVLFTKHYGQAEAISFAINGATGIYLATINTAEGESAMVKLIKK